MRIITYIYPIYHHLDDKISHNFILKLINTLIKNLFKSKFDHFNKNYCRAFWVLSSAGPIPKILIILILVICVFKQEDYRINFDTLDYGNRLRSFNRNFSENDFFIKMVLCAYFFIFLAQELVSFMEWVKIYYVYGILWSSGNIFMNTLIEFFWYGMA